MMRYGSVCSGIEAASVAWHPLGWRPSFFSEIDPFPRAVLKHRFPDVPTHGDFTTIQSGDYDAIDLLVGGTPCQSFSVAGLRGGMADERGNLALEYLRLAQRLRPRWLVWENVPGVLSSNGGRDFGSILGGMGQLGYGFAYRVLDAQFVRVDGYPRAVPQRRRRVFVVGHLGDWRPAAAVLFERASLRWDTPPRRETGKSAPTVPSRRTAGGGLGTDFDCDGGLVARCVTASQTRLDWETENFVPSVSPTLRAGGNQTGGDRPPGTDVDTCETLVPVSHTRRADGFDATEDANDADAQKTHADQALRALRDAVGEEAFAAWGIGIIAALWPKEVLQSAVHGRGVRRPTNERNGLGNNASSFAKVGPAWTVRALWEAGCDGCPPCGWQPSEQLARELGAHLSLLPHQRASASRFMLSLWRTSEGLGLLREALSAIQKVWRPAADESQPALARYAVRRLTPREAERLQGFPDDWTLVPYRGKPAADGPRYKAIGNSMAVNCMRWIGARIDQVEQILSAKVAAE